jgi:hypothetical protein
MKETIIGGLSAGGLMLGAAGLVIGAGMAKADVYGCTDDLQIWGDDDDHDGSAFARELWHDAVYLTPGQATELGNRVDELAAVPQRRRDRGRVAEKQRRGRRAGSADRESLMQIFEDMFGGSWTPITGYIRALIA